MLEVTIDGQSCMLQISDTAYQQEYTAPWDQLIRDGEGFLLVCSITSRTSFTHITRFHDWSGRVREAEAPVSPPNSFFPFEMPPIMLVGNNSDRAAEREVSTQEGYALARELGRHFVEVSVKDNVNVEKAFYDIVRDLRPQQMPATSRALAHIRSTSRQNHRRSRKKPGGVSQVWQKVILRKS